MPEFQTYAFLSEHSSGRLLWCSFGPVCRQPLLQISDLCRWSLGFLALGEKLIGQDFYQTYARITGDQGFAQIF